MFPKDKKKKPLPETAKVLEKIKDLYQFGKGLANNEVVANKAGKLETSVMTTLL
ncbi:MAG: hypothetical protein ABWX61_07885 [Paenisporosarcina sp.]